MVTLCEAKKLPLSILCLCTSQIPSCTCLEQICKNFYYGGVSLYLYKCDCYVHITYVRVEDVSA